MTCPACGGEDRLQLAPGLFKCRSLVPVVLGDPGSGAVCGHEYHSFADRADVLGSHRASLPSAEEYGIAAHLRAAGLPTIEVFRHGPESEATAYAATEPDADFRWVSQGLFRKQWVRVANSRAKPAFTGWPIGPFRHAFNVPATPLRPAYTYEKVLLTVVLDVDMPRAGHPPVPPGDLCGVEVSDLTGRYVTAGGRRTLLRADPGQAADLAQAAQRLLEQHRTGRHAAGSTQPPAVPPVIPPAA